MSNTNSIDPARLNDTIADLPGGRGPDDVGSPPNAQFELPQNIVSTKSLQFDTAHNRQSKIFIGVIGGSVAIGQRRSDGRATRWIEGGYPIGVADDRHHLLAAGSRAGKGRSVLVPNLILLPKETSTLVIDPKGDLAKATCRWRFEGWQHIVRLYPWVTRKLGFLGSMLYQLHGRIVFMLVEDTTNLNSTSMVNSANHCNATSYGNDFRYAFDWNPLFASSRAGSSPFHGSQAKNSIPAFAAVRA